MKREIWLQVTVDQTLHWFEPTTEDLFALVAELDEKHWRVIHIAQPRVGVMSLAGLKAGRVTVTFTNAHSPAQPPRWGYFLDPTSRQSTALLTVLFLNGEQNSYPMYKTVLLEVGLQVAAYFLEQGDFLEPANWEKTMNLRSS